MVTLIVPKREAKMVLKHDYKVMNPATDKPCKNKAKEIIVNANDRASVHYWETRGYVLEVIAEPGESAKRKPIQVVSPGVPKDKE